MACVVDDRAGHRESRPLDCRRERERRPCNQALGTFPDHLRPAAVSRSSRQRPALIGGRVTPPFEPEARKNELSPGVSRASLRRLPKGRAHGHFACSGRRAPPGAVCITIAAANPISNAAMQSICRKLCSTRWSLISSSKTMRASVRHVGLERHGATRHGAGKVTSALAEAEAQPDGRIERTMGTD